MRIMRLVEAGTGVGSVHAKSVKAETLFVWADVIRRANRPAGATKAAATRSTVSKRSTARSVTTSAREGKCSARPANTSMDVNVRARQTSRRNATFLLFDSTSVDLMELDQMWMGMPGNPAPEPTSTTRGNAGDAFSAPGKG